LAPFAWGYGDVARHVQHAAPPGVVLVPSLFDKFLINCALIGEQGFTFRQVLMRQLDGALEHVLYGSYYLNV
jgi:hypothetical protein